jgi:hypothetical protein
MRILTGLWFFYQKLFLPSFILSGILACFGPEQIKLAYSSALAICFFMLTPVFHYFIYEVSSPHEYYFYHNLGLSKAMLWATTIIASALIAIIFFLL